MNTLTNTSVLAIGGRRHGKMAAAIGVIMGSAIVCHPKYLQLWCIQDADGFEELLKQQRIDYTRVGSQFWGHWNNCNWSIEHHKL